jgi:UDP-N-acetyl-D-mannosaminuronic acid dehydrogenase
MKNETAQAVAQGLIDVAVVGGAGHAGLPLSLTLAASGLRVGIYDTSAEALALIRDGQMPFLERGAQALLRELLPTGRLQLSDRSDLLRTAGTVVIVIGTPVDDPSNPSLTMLDRVVDDLAPHLRSGVLVVMRSTVYPGTSAHIADTLRKRGLDVDVACCPERIAEGQALEEMIALPQIVGADERRAGDRAEELFRRLGVETIRTTTTEAELAKLFTNTWRYMKFAVANQFFMIAHAAGVDYNAVLDAIRRDYPRAADLPGPGFAAGPCLLKDTMQLAVFTADHFPMGQSAMQINEGLPAYIVDAMQRRFGNLKGRRIGILGMSFKAESDDPRASLSYKLRNLLVSAGADVACTDPYVRDERLVPLREAVETADILVLGAPHSAYRGLDVAGKEVVDVWGVIAAGITL